MLVKEIVFSPLWIFAYFVKDKASIGAWIYLWVFYFVPLIYISVLVPVPCHSAAEGSYTVSALDGGGCEASASPHLRRVSPRFHIGTSLDSPPPGPEAWALVSSPLPPPALHLESRGGRW